MLSPVKLGLSFCALILLVQMYCREVPAKAKTCQSTLSDRIIFVDAGDPFWWTYADQTSGSKNWTQSERKQICHLFQTVQIKYPQLYYRACKVNEIGLLRAEQDTMPDEFEPESSSPVAVSTTDATMIFSGGFFNAERQFQIETIVHELVHVIDMGNIISTSKEWIQLIGPAISAVRSHWKGSFAPNDLDTDRRFQNVAHQFGLIDASCSQDLNEALAVYTTDYLLNQGRRIKNPEIISFIQTQVLSSSPRLDRFRKLYIEATNATDDLNYNQALSCLNELSRDYPDATEVHASRARLWGFKHDFDMMRYEAEQELELLNRRQIPKYHHTYNRVRGLLQDAYWHHGY